MIPARRVSDFTLFRSDARRRRRVCISHCRAVWDAGRALSQLIEEESSVKGRNVLELGSGTGIGGLTAAARGAQTVLTDRPSMIALLNANIAANSLSRAATATSLEWGDYSDADRVLREHGPFDLLIGSDLLYAPEVFSSLLETLVQLSTPGRWRTLVQAWAHAQHAERRLLPFSFVI